MVSGHPSALYDEMLSDWRRVAVQVTTHPRPRSAPRWSGSTSRPSGCTGPAMPGATPPSVTRIKRKAARWAQGYRTMSAGERLAVLSAIMAVEAE